MLIPIERRAREPISDQIVAYLRRAIEAGRLAPGAKLEPIRVLAKELGVNRETVAVAYRELERLGLTESTVGRGTFVEGRGPTPIGVAARVAPAERPFEPTFARASEAALYEYGNPRGDLGLRRALVERMARAGIEADPDDVLITAGATQGFAIVTRLFCDAGDAVALESPSYPWAFGALTAMGVRALPVPMTGEGIDLERLDAVLGRDRARLLYTMPSFHNPTGITTSLAHRRRLLELAGKHGVPVLEDDFEKDLRVRGRGAPPLRALDRRGLVLYMGTFSKSLFPAARVGWLFLPPGVMSAALVAKRALDLTTSPLIQAGLALFLREGRYERHLRRVVKELGRRLEAAERALARELPAGASVASAEGGFLLWVTLPAPLDATALLPEAKRAGVVYAPGELFHPDGRGAASLRISLAHTPVPELERGIRILGEVIRAAQPRSKRARAARAPEAVHV